MMKKNTSNVNLLHLVNLPRFLRHNPRLDVYLKQKRIIDMVLTSKKKPSQQIQQFQNISSAPQLTFRMFHHLWFSLVQFYDIV